MHVGIGMAVSRRGGDSLRGKAGTQPSSGVAAARRNSLTELSHSARGCRDRLEDHLEQPGASVASELEDYFPVVASLHLIPACSVDFLLVCLAVQ